MVVADRARVELDKVAKERLCALHADEKLFAGVDAALADKRRGTAPRSLEEVLAAIGK